MISKTTSTARKSASYRTSGEETDFSLVQATSAHRRQVALAGKMRAVYGQSPAQYLMRFQDFQKPNRRNRILSENGFDPIVLPFDPRPAQRRSNRRKKSTRG